MYCHGKVLGVHIHSWSVSQIGSHAIHRAELERLNEGHREEVGLCAPEHLAGAPAHIHLLVTPVKEPTAIAATLHTCAFHCQNR